jgi:hypothetical protein
MPEPLARATFDYTLDEAADVVWRQSRRLRSLRSHPWITAVIMALVSGALLLIVFGWAFPDNPKTLVVWIAAGGALAAGIFGYVRYGHHYRRAVRRMLREAHGDDPLHCEVELHHEHVRVLQPQTALTFPWPDVESVGDEDGDIVLLAKRGGVLVVRQRAFTGERERLAFLDLMRQLAARHAAKG